MAPLTASGTSRGKAVLFSTVLLLVLPFPFIVLRLWSRRMNNARFALNDYLILIALFFTTAFSVNSMLAAILGGYGQHIEMVSEAELEEFSKALVVATVLWPSANALIKLSVLHFYKTVFSVKKRTVQASYVLAVFTTCYWLVGVIMAFAICVPFEYNWNKAIPGHCGNVAATYLAIAIINLLIDVMVVILPLPSVWSLQMRLPRKIALSFVFSLGAVICVISVVRCWSIATLEQSDLTYSVVLDEVFTTLELALGIVIACLPILQPIATRLSRTKAGSYVQSLLSDPPGSSVKVDQPVELYPKGPDGAGRSRQRRHLNEITTSLAHDDSIDERDSGSIAESATASHGSSKDPASQHSGKRGN